MKDKLKKLFSSESVYSILKVIGDFIVNSTEVLFKQWLGTVIGQRFLKWLTDILISRFYDTIIVPLMRVGVIRLGYYYDVNSAEEKIKKLKLAEDSNDVDEYLRTLNTVFTK